MKDGVEYVLRVRCRHLRGQQWHPGADVVADESTGRYLLVMARFNEGLLEKPLLEEVPADGGELAGTSGKEPAAEGDAADQLKAADEAEAKARAALESGCAVERENRRPPGRLRREGDTWREDAAASQLRATGTSLRSGRPTRSRSRPR